MPYSLVSAATLGFDLVRLPCGAEVAQVLLGGLGADAGLLTRLAAATPVGADHAVRAVQGRRARELAAAAVPQLRDVGTRAPADRLAALVTSLEQSTIGSVASLERLVRDDVLGPEHPAVGAVPDDVRAAAADVLADAAVAAWSAAGLPAAVVTALATPYGTATGGAGPSSRQVLDLGPATRELLTALGLVRHADEPTRERWRAAVDTVRADWRPWAAAMHEACWAAHLTGRTRALAAAQLYAVQAFLDGGLTAQDGALGVWNALAGCVQGLAVADLLDESSLAVLTAPWSLVTGPPLLPR